MSECEKIAEIVEPVFPSDKMEGLIDLLITEITFKKYGKIWHKRYCTNDIVHVYHRAGAIEIDNIYFAKIKKSVMDKIIKYQNNGKTAFNLRRIVKRAIRYEAS